MSEVHLEISEECPTVASYPAVMLRGMRDEGLMMAHRLLCGDFKEKQ